MYEIVFSSQQLEPKDFRKHGCNVLFPHVWQEVTNKMKEDHQDPVTDHDNQIQALEFTNEKHQQKILRLNKENDDLIANRHVARCRYFDNLLCLIKKNSGEVYPHYVTRCQYRQLEKYMQWIKLFYPNMEMAAKCDDTNAIHWWNRFKRKVIKKADYYKNHFRLTEGKRELLETALDVTI